MRRQRTGSPPPVRQILGAPICDPTGRHAVAYTYTSDCLTDIEHRSCGGIPEGHLVVETRLDGTHRRADPIASRFAQHLADQVGAGSGLLHQACRRKPADRALGPGRQQRRTGSYEHLGGTDLWSGDVDKSQLPGLD